MMKKSIAFLLVLCASLVFAQKKHEVQPKETIYGISKQYQITQDQLIEANPFLKDRALDIGDVLIIPQKSEAADEPFVANENYQEVPKEDKDFIYLKILPKQTLYSISKEYDVKQDALLSLNPQLKEGLKVDDIIRIPRKDKPIPDGMHQVKEDDTVMSLSEYYGVSVDDVYISNPDLQTDGLKEGAFLNVPKKKNATIQDDHIAHIISKDDTIFTILNAYDITYEELLALNPGIENGFQVGDTIKIPLKEGAVILKPKKIERIQDEQINLVLMLPFYLNDETNMYEKERAISTDMLTGTKVALDVLARDGKQIYLKVFDTQNDIQRTYEFIESYDFSKVDAIVGPLYKENIVQLAKYLEQSEIPIVSPILNSKELDNYKNVVITEPRDEDIADKLISEIQKRHQGEKVILLTDSNKEDLAAMMQEKLKDYLPNTEVIVTKRLSDLEVPSEKITEDINGAIYENEIFEPIFTVLVSRDNTLAKQYLQRLNLLNEDYLHAFSFEQPSAFDIFSDSNYNNYMIMRKVGFTFTTAHFMNVKGTTESRILGDFANRYCENPSFFEAIGHDVVYDVVSRMNAGGDFYPYIFSEGKGLSSSFNYERLDKNQAVINKGIRVINIEPKKKETEETEEEFSQ